MINYEYSGLFLQDSIDKQLHIYYDNGASHITNTDLYAEEFTLRESICSDSQLRFGGCESSSVEFKIANSGASLKGKSINVQMVLDGHTEAPFTVGTYKVQSDKPTADRFGRVVTAYDAMYDVINADVSDWWKSLSTSFSLKALRNSFFSYFGITQKAVSLPNDNIMVTQKPELDKVSGKDVITAICELNGCFGHINRDNQMVYLTLGEIIEGLFPADDLFPQNVLYPREERVGAILTKSVYTHAEYEDYTVQSISGIRMYNSKNELIASYKTATNVYNITDNILADGISSADALTVLQNLYSQIGNIWYMPCSVECIGNPCIEAGDSVQLATSDRVIYMFVMERTLKGIQALKDTYESHGDEYRIDEMDSIANKVKAVTAKADNAYNYADTANRNAGTAYDHAESAYQLAATKVTAKEVEAQIGTFGFLNAKQVDAEIAAFGYVTATDVSAQIGTYNFLTSNDISTFRLDASQITTGTIDSRRIDAEQIAANIINNNYFNGRTIQCQSLWASDYVRVQSDRIDVGGTSYGKRKVSVRLSSGGTTTITYLGA